MCANEFAAALDLCQRHPMAEGPSTTATAADPPGAEAAYALDDQVGFMLRRALQRHLALFAEGIPEVTNTQFAALARLDELGPLSQNRLGRATAMDATTIKGVVDRLAVRGLVAIAPDPDDRRRLRVTLTDAGRDLFASLRPRALQVSRGTLAPLAPAERATLLRLLARLV
jgi:MarR family transcriptional regulator, lower aerobic nicotinate degradation pathway regulator